MPRALPIHELDDAAVLCELRRWLHDDTLQVLEYVATAGHGTCDVDTLQRAAARAADALRHRIERPDDPLAGSPLGAAVRAVADQVGERMVGVVGVTCEPSVEAWSGPAADAVVLACRELLNNAARHAAARTVRVRVDATPAGIAAVVEDDGCGFDPDTMRLRGLRHSVAARVEPLGGSATIASALGRGTSACITVPAIGTTIP